jgi:hypothetical protein
MVFPNVPQNSSVRKIFFLTNTGDTTLEVGFFDERNQPLPGEARTKSTGKIFSYQINPPMASIPPKSKKQFAITITVSLVLWTVPIVTLYTPRVLPEVKM